MSEHFDKRRADIESILERHYDHEHHRLNQAVLAAEAEIAESPARVAHGIKSVQADERRHLGLLREKVKGFERELVDLAADREPLERELGQLRKFLDSADADRGLGRDTT